MFRRAGVPRLVQRSSGSSSSSSSSGGPCSGPPHGNVASLGLPVLATLANPELLGTETHQFRSVLWRRAMCKLYRTILKLHAIKLSALQRQFGDRFVREQFRQHVLATEHYSIIFYRSWFAYAAQLESGVTSRQLSSQERELLNEDQKSKLHELRSKATKLKVDSGDFIL